MTNEPDLYPEKSVSVVTRGAGGLTRIVSEYLSIIPVIASLFFVHDSFLFINSICIFFCHVFIFLLCSRHLPYTSDAR